MVLAALFEGGLLFRIALRLGSGHSKEGREFLSLFLFLFFNSTLLSFFGPGRKETYDPSCSISPPSSSPLPHPPPNPLHPLPPLPLPLSPRHNKNLHPPIHHHPPPNPQHRSQPHLQPPLRQPALCRLHVRVHRRRIRVFAARVPGRGEEVCEMREEGGGFGKGGDEVGLVGEGVEDC